MNVTVLLVNTILVCSKIIQLSLFLVSFMASPSAAMQQVCATRLLSLENQWLKFACIDILQFEPEQIGRQV